MKILLRDTRTGLFYAGPNQWSPGQEQAQDFKTPDIALDLVDGSSLKAMELVVHFDDAAFDVPLTIVNADPRNL